MFQYVSNLSCLYTVITCRCHVFLSFIFASADDMSVIPVVSSPRFCAITGAGGGYQWNGGSQEARESELLREPRAPTNEIGTPTAERSIWGLFFFCRSRTLNEGGTMYAVYIYIFILYIYVCMYNLSIRTYVIIYVLTICFMCNYESSNQTRTTDSDLGNQMSISWGSNHA